MLFCCNFHNHRAVGPEAIKSITTYLSCSKKFQTFGDLITSHTQIEHGEFFFHSKVLFTPNRFEHLSSRFDEG